MELKIEQYQSCASPVELKYILTQTPFTIVVLTLISDQ